ncbi:XRE family transcriptional regulator [Streptomyces sp. NBC_00102]|uniref:XRE family transcriptional regulator n=1 Tax=Streptomyces sp. NBC_00102 TaxID=2975652 RepID=UPI002255E807|nr:XRE family transcriptional regulator [Streptomyces sp. NBC_00102]MCX5401316.1 XRE family transcriptional regulator [Streptomyces sp. NBC_00102]
MEQLAEATAPNPLAELMNQIGLRPEQLVARINELRHRRGSHPLDLKSAYPWLRGQPSRPNQENERDALTVLSSRAGRTVTAAELSWSGPRRRPHRRWLDSPGDAPMDALLREIIQGDPMDRRNLLLLAGAAATAPGLALLIGNGSAQAAERGGRLSSQLVGGIENSVRELRELDDTDGSTAGLLWAGGLWQSVARVVAHARDDSPTGRRLHTAFVELSEQYGWMLFDADLHPQAQRVYQTGMCLAREAAPSPDTRFATSNLLASAGYQASWLSQHSEARTFLDVAGRDPGGLPPRLGAVIAERQIFAAGRRGDTEQLRRARDTAHNLLDKAGGDGPWWSRWLSHHAIDAVTGRAWLAAQDPRAAEPYLTRSLTATDDAFPRDRMLAVLDLADTRRLQGEPHAALALTHEAAALAEQVHSPRAQNRLREITTALPPHTQG